MGNPAEEHDSKDTAQTSRAWDPSRYTATDADAPAFALLILNQPLLPHDHFVALLENSSYTVCADGGANQLRVAQACMVGSGGAWLPQAIIGDLDSVHPKIRRFYERRGVEVIEDRDQDASDLTKALRLIASKTPEIRAQSHRRTDSRGTVDVVILGSMAGRLDQAFSQLHHLHAAAHDATLPQGNIFLFTPETVSFLLGRGANKIETPLSAGFLMENVGILPLGRPATITTKGLEWDVSDWDTEFGGKISTSNHVKADVVEVSVDGDAVLFTIELSRPSDDRAVDFAVLALDDDDDDDDDDEE